MIKIIKYGSNHVIVKLGNIEILFSYATPVAYSENGCSYKTSKKWSVTTSKHINSCGYANAKEVTQEKLDNLIK